MVGPVPDGGLETSESALSRVARVAFRQDGITLREITESLGVSRSTILRWLNLMESDGLIEKTTVMTGRRGRPKGVYRPTERLRRLIATQRSGHAVVLSFEDVRGVCRFFVGGVCVRGGRHPCGPAVCPILSS